MVRPPNNDFMKIKPTQIYDWESEPVDERPSEFMNSRSHASTSGFQSTGSLPRRAPRRRHHPLRFTTLVTAMIAVVALGSVVVGRLLTMLLA